MAARNFGTIPAPGELTGADRELLATGRAGFGTVGELLAGSRQKAAIGEAMRVVAAANKYLSDQAPWKLTETDRDRMGTILYTALQAVDDCKALLTPFLPHSSGTVHRMLGNDGTWSAMPELREVDEADGPSYGVLTGEYDTAEARWESRPIAAGRPLHPPTPVFKKLDASIVDEELDRLARGTSG